MTDNIDTIDSPYIYTANAVTFKQRVLENSHRGPVLVNFWSKKVEPCLRLYLILDKVVHHHDGRLLLVNVDADKESAIASEYGIGSVPTLKLFREARVVETLHGFQSEDAVHKVLEQYIARDSDLLLADAIELYTTGDTVGAYEKIAVAIVDDPNNHRLPLTMCKLLNHERRFSEALQLIDSLPDDLKKINEIKSIRKELELSAESESRENN